MIKSFFKNKIVRAIIWVHLGILVALIGFFFYIKRNNHKVFDRGIKRVPYDVIIVPGYPYEQQWSDIMKTRIYWSKYLWEQGYAKNIIYSGSAVYSPYIEGLLMKHYAEALGIPGPCLFAETKAEHSTENLYYSYVLAKHKGFNKIALATDPFQSFFLQQYAGDKHFDIDFLPMQYSILKQIDLADIRIDADLAFKEKFEALPDRENFWQRLKGTLGGNIKTKILE